MSSILYSKEIFMVDLNKLDRNQLLEYFSKANVLLARGEELTRQHQQLTKDYNNRHNIHNQTLIENENRSLTWLDFIIYFVIWLVLYWIVDLIIVKFIVYPIFELYGDSVGWTQKDYSSSSWYIGIFFMILTAIPVIRWATKITKFSKEEKAEQTNNLIVQNRTHFLTKSEELKTKMVAFYNEWNNSFPEYPALYRHTHAANFFCEKLSNWTANTVIEVTQLYEEELHRQRQLDAQYKLIEEQRRNNIMTEQYYQNSLATLSNIQQELHNNNVRLSGIQDELKKPQQVTVHNHHNHYHEHKR